MPERVQPHVETPSLILRPLRRGDVDTIFLLSREEGMRTWLPSQVYADRQHAASVVAFLVAQIDSPGDPRSGPYVLGVRLRASGALIGHVGLSPLQSAVEVGFAIGEAHQGRGYASEAVRAVCPWACDTFALDSILGIAAAGNVVSQRVLMRAGFERRSEERRRFQGTEQPVVVFGFSMATIPRAH